ncbi:BREX-1 system phosphatase PglZ type A [Methyloversatilis sp.]|uniref:BREX-1 system phosphatase PglZ type A n=1 Tax=Methyloversatilis sp. TaxID=2569862 RepID=UPI0027330A0C|nr:BREX-1 system phosphatase PglZ type A [Methyloversatilis sp.]MDP3457033.1 BREX-1 system phosphatase PglZ type A [Methyloversatilis sp.]
MMSPRIAENLARIFGPEQARVVLWHDAAREFEADLASLVLDGVELLRLDQMGALEAKIHIESADIPGRYLIYAPFEAPEPEKDWLLDIRLYGRIFSADTVSILLDELGLASQGMHGHLAARMKFLRARERVERLKKWVAQQDTEVDLDLKMLAVVTRAEQPEAFALLTRLFVSAAQDDGGSPFQSVKVWQDIEALELEDAFWALMARTFGYVQPHPGLMDLLLRLLVTDLSLALHGALPEALKHFVLPLRGLAVNASVFIAQWRNHLVASSAHDTLVRRAASELKVADHLGGLAPELLVDAMTFEEVEKIILREWRDRVLKEGADIRLAELREAVQRRRDGHWASPARQTEHANAFRAGYNAIEAAAEMAVLKGKFVGGLQFPSAVEGANAYLSQLYRFDQLYRLFHEAADEVELANWDVLKALRAGIEEIYNGWFVPMLATAWGGFMEGSGGLLANWQLYGLDNQYRFFENHVRPVLENAPRARVFVLISDAFRYEAAAELAEELNGKYRFKASLGAMLGVLPSYTALGMAALLPHERLGYKGGGEVMVDGKSCAGLEQRGKILAEHSGVAIRAEDLLAMNKDAGREFVKPWRVVYVYHNQVDAVGDSASTESQTFAAVRTAIRELAAMVRFIINGLNGNTVLITADHGFLYQDSMLDAFDKSALDEKPAGAVIAKKRYLIGPALNKGEQPKAWCGNTARTARTDPGMDFWVPKGANRFHFTGGARFTHGGAMPQEILVPLVTVKELEGKAAESTAMRKVDVSLLGSSRKIVNNMQRFEFIQNEAVSERVQARTLLISIRESSAGGSNELVSNEAALTFASDSDRMDERKQTARLVLKAGNYDKTRPYALVLIDAESKAEVSRITFNIDLTFSNDF